MTKLILTTEVSGLGAVGDVIEVKNGYARNYLIPQGFAMSWNRGSEKQIERLKAAKAIREAATEESAKERKIALELNPIRVQVKAGREGRLFGSVKPADIAQAIADAGLGVLAKQSIQIAAPIKVLGRHEATARLSQDIDARLILEVVAAKK